MTYRPAFSVCIPNYNHGAYIGDTIQSVLDQTYQEFEIVIADNASTDNSVEVIEKFKDPRIKLIRNRYNIGFAPNLQRVTMYARNDYINLLSSDDQMKPDALETYANILMGMDEVPDYVVMYSNAELFDDHHSIGYTYKNPKGFDTYNVKDGQPEQSGQKPYEVYSGRAVLADALRRLRTFAPFLSTVYSRSLWEAVEGYNSVRTIGPDKHFGFKILAKDPVVIYVPRALFRYRFHLSLNRATQYTTLKQLIDDYLYTIEYKDEELRELGLSHEMLIRTYLDDMCLERALSQMGDGNYVTALRFFAFAMASYPGITLRRPKTYLLLPLLFMGPLAKLVAPILKSAYKRLTPARNFSR